MAKLTAAARKKIPKSNFAVPSKAPKSGSYPIEDRGHATGRAVAFRRQSGRGQGAGGSTSEISHHENLSATPRTMKQPGDESVRILASEKSRATSQCQT